MVLLRSITQDLNQIDVKYINFKCIIIKIRFWFNNFKTDLSYLFAANVLNREFWQAAKIYSQKKITK